jgi:TetR/AcrR family transcriptional repressor of nem operon
MMIVIYFVKRRNGEDVHMKVTREQAALNRDRIIDVAGRLFRERGFDGIGVADLMKEAGLTHGGFYGHFESKEDLAAEACGRALARTAALWREAVAKGGRQPLKVIADRYLSARHRDDIGGGCLYAALTADIARRDNPALRLALTDGLRRAVDLLAGLVPGRTKAAQRKRALAQFATMMGALILARAVDDETLSEEFLAAARAAVAETAD